MKLIHLYNIYIYIYRYVPKLYIYIDIYNLVDTGGATSSTPGSISVMVSTPLTISYDIILYHMILNITILYND